MASRGMQTWDPFREMVTLRDAMDSLFENAMIQPFGSNRGSRGQFLPVDVMENDDDFVIRASLPGMKPEDLDVTVVDNLVTIEGELGSDDDKQSTQTGQSGQTMQSTQSGQSGQSTQSGQAMQSKQSSKSNQWNQSNDKMTRNQRYHVRERGWGTFSRQIALPTSVNADQVKAEYQDGVLTLTLPKSEEAKPKRIQVQGSGQQQKTIEGKAQQR